MWGLWWTKRHWGRFSPSTSVSPANLHSTKFSIIIITRGWHSRPISGRSTEWAQLTPPPTIEIKKNCFLYDGIFIYRVVTQVSTAHYPEWIPCTKLILQAVGLVFPSIYSFHLEVSNSLSDISYIFQVQWDRSGTNLFSIKIYYEILLVSFHLLYSNNFS
jgi:hypothetical protein